jgi:hypothetical protein
LEKAPDLMNATTLRRLRQLHNYLGVFFAPAIVFFAFSGLFQTLGLHENRGGGAYQPPAWIVTIASLHKDQRLPRPKPPRPEAPIPDAEAPQSHVPPALRAPMASKAPSPIPLKAFVLLVSVALMATTLVGVVIALTMRATRRLSLTLLALGTVLPPLLLLI